MTKGDIDNLFTMKRSITLGEAILASLTLLGVIIGFYANTLVRLNGLELRMQQQEQDKILYRDDIKALGFKIDGLKDNINDLKVTIQNKQDKK